MAGTFRTGAVLLVVALSGCARLNSIYRSEPVPTDKAHVVSIDAKQRAVISNPMRTNGNSGAATQLRFCAEPPPDVFSAYASSLGAKASLSNDATAKQIGAEFAATISENAATIERSQTVNVLRESMYRTCERYLSGAISEQEFIIQSARDQRAMVQVMAVEQLTGAARAQSTALITTARAMAGGTTELSVKALETARKEVLDRRATLQKMDAELADTDPKDKTCDTLPAAPTDGSADPQKVKRERCAARAAAAAQLKESENHYASLLKTVNNQSVISSEASGELVAEAMRASTVSEALAKQVVQIVAINNAFDEIGMTCLALMRSEKLTLHQQAFVDACTKNLALLVNAQTQREKAILSEYQKILKAIVDAEQEIWDAITTSDKVDAGKVDTLIKNSKQIVADSDISKLKAAKREDLSDILQSLGPTVTKALRDAAKP